MRKPRSFRCTNPRSGLTLLEMVVVVIILMALAGVLIPLAKDLMMASKVNRILATVDAAREACMRFHNDTDQYAIEDSGLPGGSATPPIRLLSETPSPAIPGWKGPYLRRALTPADNPYGERVIVHNSLNGSPYGGFDLLGEGVLISGNGNMIVFQDLPDDLVEAVDAKLDLPLKGMEGENWGRCVYRNGGGDTCDAYIFLLREAP